MDINKIMSNNVQINYLYPITETMNTQNTAQAQPDNIISILFAAYNAERLSDVNEREGFIRNPSTPEPNALESFKPKLHELVPELKNLTDEELEKILEDEDEE